MRNETPFTLLSELTEQGASGEFVCVAPSAELHVYLQNGRVAWATDSSSPLAFSRWLLEHTGLTREVYLEVLESCRIDRLPLGETLVAWNVVSVEEIQSALRFQNSGALTHLQTCDVGKTIFLERKREFASYDARLTFELDDLVVPPPRESSIIQGSGLLDRLTAEIPDADWFELLDGGVTVGQLPEGPSSRVDPRLAKASVLDGADLVAHRSARGTMLGVALGQHRSVWCRLDPEMAFATALGTICAAADVDIRTTPPMAFDPSDAPNRPLQRIGNRPHVLRVLEAFLAQAPEVLGAVVAERGDTTAATMRRPWDPHVLTSLVERRSGLLDVSPSMSDAPPSSQGMHRSRSLVTAERNLWCFGAEVGTGIVRRTLWLFLDRGTAQGLGWAYLATLTRQLEPVLVDEPASSWTQTA